MKNKIEELISKPVFLTVSWIIFFASPGLGTLRLLYIQNKVSLGINIPGITTILYYTPFIIALIVLTIQLIWLKNFVTGKIKVKHGLALTFVTVIAIIFVYYVQKLLNLQFENYPNYIYSKYGIPSSQLQLMSFISFLEIAIYGAFVFLRFNRKKSVKDKNSSSVLANELFGGKKITLDKISTLVALISLLVMFISCIHIFLNWQILYSTSSEGYQSKVGSDYKYIEMLFRYTPTNSIVIHPPQGDYWPAIGNQPLIRYFLHPRVLVSGALVVDQEFTRNIDGGYFIEINPTDVRPVWPNLITNENRISFDGVNFVKYLNIELLTDPQLGKIYKIKF